MHIFQFRISFPFHHPVSPPPKKILCQMSSESCSRADRCIRVALQSHQPSRCLPSTLVRCFPHYWGCPETLGPPHKQPSSLLRFHVGMLWKLRLSLSSWGSFPQRSQAAHRNRRVFLVACFHEKHKIFVSSRPLPFYII